MWTFDAPPLDYWEATYGFRPTQDWLDHVRLASIRLPGCSSSFVSENGLVMTNHHCARGYVQRMSPPDQDWLGDGYFANSLDDEVPIERLTVGLPRPSDDLSRETCRFLRLGHAARQIEGGRL